LSVAKSKKLARKRKRVVPRPALRVTAAQKRLRKQKAAARRALHAARAKTKQPASNGKETRLHPVDLASVHDRLVHRVGFLDKREVLAVVGCTYPALWGWQLAGTFPRARIVFGKSKWSADVIADWIDRLPPRPLKGDAPPDQKSRRLSEARSNAAARRGARAPVADKKRPALWKQAGL
jgi:predicted DNA-binding transcriptional regulator AlpA